MLEQQPDIAVKYIFRRPYWKDNVYGTGLTFTTGQVRNLPHDIALKFLRHTDTFEIDKAKTAKAEKDADKEQKGVDAAIEATEAQRAEEARLVQERLDQEQKEKLAAAQKEKDEQAQREQDLHDLHDQLGQMNKEAVIRFAAEKFNTPLDKKHSVDQLRLEAKALVDRFGVT